MKKLKKSLIAILSVLCVLCMFTGCAKSSGEIESEARSEIHEDTVEAVGSMLENNIASLLVQADYDMFEGYIGQGQTFVNPAFDNDLRVRWKEFRDLHGEITDAYLDGVEREGKEFAGHLVLTGEDGEQMRLNIEISETCTPISTTMEAYSDDSKDSFGTKMSKAGMRTVTGLLVVFVVLIVLCLIISCFLLIGKGGKKQKASGKADEKKAAPAVKAAPETAVKETALKDDSELIAVIAAAIAASENRPAEGFVVRSIKRLGNNKW